MLNLYITIPPDQVREWRRDPRCKTANKAARFFLSQFHKHIKLTVPNMLRAQHAHYRRGSYRFKSVASERGFLTADFVLSANRLYFKRKL